MLAHLVSYRGKGVDELIALQLFHRQIVARRPDWHFKITGNAIHSLVAQCHLITVRSRVVN